MNQRRFNRLKKEWSENEYDIVDGYYIDPDSGNGDLFYNTTRWITENPTADYLDHLTLDEMFACLTSGKRWPNNMDFLITTTNHKQTDITKDPWIMAYCCAVHLGRYDLIKEYPPPTEPTGYKWRKWSYFRAFEMAWYNALLGDDKKWKRWRWIGNFIPVKHTFVMYGFMCEAYNQIKNN
jgi:hypothetical protein